MTMQINYIRMRYLCKNVHFHFPFYLSKRKQIKILIWYTVTKGRANEKIVQRFFNFRQVSIIGYRITIRNNNILF